MKCKECDGRMYQKYRHILKDGSVARRKVCSNCGNTLRTVEVNKSEYESLKRLKNDLQWAVNRYIEWRNRS